MLSVIYEYEECVFFCNLSEKKRKRGKIECAHRNSYCVLSLSFTLMKHLKNVSPISRIKNYENPSESISFDIRSLPIIAEYIILNHLFFLLIFNINKSEFMMAKVIT